ncbi:MAG: YIP1 family protein [archaeon]
MCLKKILTKPEQFFAKTDKQKKYFLIVPLYIFCYVVLAFLLELVIPNPVKPQTLVTAVALLAAMLVLVFFFSLLMYSFAKLMNGKGKYKETFAAFAHVLLPLFWFALVPSLVLNILTRLLTPQLTREMTYGYGFATYFVFILIFLFIILAVSTVLYGIILNVIAQKTVHKLDTFKTFIAVVALPLLVLGIIAVILYLSAGVSTAF